MLFARRTVIIPGAYLPPVTSDGTADGKNVMTRSLRPRPVESEEEDRRKRRIRRWMLACREPDYDLALLYLESTGYDVEEAVARYQEDDRWERENPLPSAVPCSSRAAAAASLRKGGGSDNVKRTSLMPPRR